MKERMGSFTGPLHTGLFVVKGNNGRFFFPTRLYRDLYKSILLVSHNVN